MIREFTNQAEWEAAVHDAGFFVHRTPARPRDEEGGESVEEHLLDQAYRGLIASERPQLVRGREGNSVGHWHEAIPDLGEGGSPAFGMLAENATEWHAYVFGDDEGSAPEED